MKFIRQSIHIIMILLAPYLHSEARLNIDLNKSNTLNCITVNQQNQIFYPSVWGGIAVVLTTGEIIYPWSPGVNFVELNRNSIHTDLESEWLMYIPNVFYYHYLASFRISENSATIRFKDLGPTPNRMTQNLEYASIYGVYLDRCENANKPVNIAVPYLTTFNILFANNCFTSIYFDWQETHASQIIPYQDQKYSDKSIYFSQFALYNPLTSGVRNTLDETVVIKVSSSIDNVFPQLNNPKSAYLKESASRIVFDDWHPFLHSLEKLQNLKKNNIQNLWHIVHDWQRSGYDVSLPEMYPPNPNYGGKNELLKICEFNRINNNLFSLHENYIDIFKSSSYFTTANLALNPNGKFIFDWYTWTHSDSGFVVKPERLLEIISPLSRQIHEQLYTNSSFHDVSSSYDPSKYVDYDHNSIDAGKFLQPYNAYRILADSLREIHKGPVSGEGLAHFIYVGYYDDIAAQIHTAKSLPGAYYNHTEKLGGYYKPLFVNFDLLKMKEKALVHGVGYYERFFFNNEYWKYRGQGYDSALSYAATELAYGHGAFFSTHSFDYIEQGNIECTYVYPMQLRYWNSAVISILYNDNNRLISASDYIRKYPDTFDDFFNKHFMSQVYVIYSNGVIVCVNRHPTKEWIVELDKGNGYYNYNALRNNEHELFQGITTGGKFVLPPTNGWLCYSQR